MAMEYRFGQMELDMKESGSKTELMGRASLSMLTGMFMKETG